MGISLLVCVCPWVAYVGVSVLTLQLLDSYKTLGGSLGGSQIYWGGGGAYFF